MTNSPSQFDKTSSLQRVLAYSSYQELFQNPLFKRNWFPSRFWKIAELLENDILALIASTAVFLILYFLINQDSALLYSIQFTLVAFLFTLYYNFLTASRLHIIRAKESGLLQELTYSGASSKEIAFGYVYQSFIMRDVFLIICCSVCAFFPFQTIPESRYGFIVISIIRLWNISRRPRLGVITCYRLFSAKRGFFNLMRTYLFLFSAVSVQLIFTALILLVLMPVLSGSIDSMALIIGIITVILIIGIVSIQFFYYRMNTRLFNRLSSEYDCFDDLLKHQILGER